MPAKRIVYLFGAGATHADLLNSEQNLDEAFKSRYGLLISHVARRVMNKTQRRLWFRQNRDVMASKKGTFNIELYISLLESNNCPQEEIQALKKLVRDDIETILSGARKEQFYLHKALLELHTLIPVHEELLGFISLNYDDVLDEAYLALYGQPPEYCLRSDYGDGLPLLKLHGSFNWNDISIYGRIETIPIIPLGMNKNYLTPPYNFIWGRAYELLTQCDILRVIGCSMNQNDIGLIDLLFKAHKQRQASFEVQLIDFQPKGNHVIKDTYGFLPNIVNPEDIERRLIKDPRIRDTEVGNPFQIWLKARIERVLEDSILSRDDIRKTKFLKKEL